MARWVSCWDVAAVAAAVAAVTAATAVAADVLVPAAQARAERASAGCVGLPDPFPARAGDEPPRGRDVAAAVVGRAVARAAYLTVGVAARRR